MATVELDVLAVWAVTESSSSITSNELVSTIGETSFGLLSLAVAFWVEFFFGLPRFLLTVGVDTVLSNKVLPLVEANESSLFDSN